MKRFNQQSMKLYNRSIKVLLFIFIGLQSLQAQIPTDLTVLDDFSDGNFTANPVWTPAEGSGLWTITSITNRPNIAETNMNSGDNPNFFSALTTPFTKVCNAWQIDFVVSSSSTPGRKMEYYFLMTSANSDPRKASGYKLSYHLYVLDGSTRRNFLYLQKVTNGVADNQPIIAYNNGTFFSLERLTITNEGDLWKLYVGTTLRGSGTDNTYSPSEAAYQAIAVIDSVPYTSIDRYRFDNIKYRENVQTSVGSTDPISTLLQVRVFPNPVLDLVQARVQSPKTDRGELRLLDLQGRTLYSKSVFINSGTNRYDLNLSEKHIRSGLYILELRTGTQVQQTKLMVQ